MAATDKFIKVGNPGSATSLAAPGYTVGDGTITVVSTTNWPAGPAGCVFAIDIIGADGLRIDGTYNVYQGTVATATSITNVSHISGTGTNRNYPAGTTTRVYIVVASEIQNRLVDGLIVEHDQDGTHKNITTDTIVTSGNVTIGGTLTIGGSGSGGYDPITGTITAVTANGNRSYDLTTSADNTGLISPGMRARSTRTVAAPTQCTSLNGTTQYYSKTTPAGMTFTDDFVAGAWVKLSSYAEGMIMSRHNGTNGWFMDVNSSGQVFLNGTNAALGNYNRVITYQSLPLNKWVHVAAQLDMSTAGVSATTSYIMFDGVDVPTQKVTAGTAPTTLIQAGNLEIGAYNGGLLPFPGKIAQAFVSSAKITQANIKTLYSQGLTPALITANSIISAYSFDGIKTDLNTTSANNLTANGSAVETNADSFAGGQADGTISSTLDYGIIQKVTASTITVQVAEGCTIPTSGGVSSLSYATVKSPYGFPGEKDKWIVFSFYQIDSTATLATNNVWVAVPGGKVEIPIGAWTYGMSGAFTTQTSGAVGIRSGFIALATALPTDTSASMKQPVVVRVLGFVASAAQSLVDISKDVKLSTATTYNVYGMSDSITATESCGIRGLQGPVMLYAENAYL